MGAKSNYPERMIGKKFGKLKVVSVFRGDKSKSGSYIYRCKCECECGNNEFETHATSVLKGKTTSCGCRKDQYLKLTGKNNVGFNGYEEIRSAFWNKVKRGAKDRDIEFSISIEYVWQMFLKQGRKCKLSGVQIHFGTTKYASNTTVSIDRINSSIGYVEGNIQLVHKKINIMKNSTSNVEFLEWCKKVYENTIY